MASTFSSRMLLATGIFVLGTMFTTGPSSFGVNRTVGAVLSRMTTLVTMSTRLLDQDSLYLLSLSLGDCLTVSVKYRGAYFARSGVNAHFEQPRDNADQKFHLASHCPLDGLRHIFASGMRMSVFASADSGFVALCIVIDPDAKRTIRCSSAASTDALLVAVEYMRSKILFDGPFMERLLEGEETRKDLIFYDWRHWMGGSRLRVVRLLYSLGDWHSWSTAGTNLGRG